LMLFWRIYIERLNWSIGCKFQSVYIFVVADVTTLVGV
jgi:hypothetical protein